VEIQKYLPSKEFGKRFLVVFLIAVVFFGISELVGYIKNKKSVTAGPTEAVLGKDFVNVTVGDIIEVDTDKDGIRDFEEILYGTNPDITETTPGIPDRQIIEDIRARSKDKTNEEKLDINETSQFAGEFLSSIIALDRAGLITEESTDKIANSFFEYIKNIPDTDTYTKESFQTFDSETALPKTSAYIKVLADILTDNIFENDDSVMIVGLALRKGETSQLKRLAGNKARYEKAEARLRILVVPKQNLESHIALINSFDAFGRYISDMQTIEEDPLPGFVAITRYNENIKKYKEGISGTMNFLTPYINLVAN